MDPNEKAIRMEVRGLMLDKNTNLPIVVLRDASGKRILPIWIGVFEANAIAMQLEEVTAPRPMTHDLFAASFSQLDLTLDRAVIHDLRDNTFYASLYVRRPGADEGEEIAIDSRPSDAIAIALRLNAPIFVLQEVLDKAKREEARPAPSEIDEDKLREWLEQADPDEFGDYDM